MKDFDDVQSLERIVWKDIKAWASNKPKFATRTDMVNAYWNEKLGTNSPNVTWADLGVWEC